MPVVDTSVALKWVIDEPDSPAARALLPAARGTYVAPALILVEAHYAVAKSMIRGWATEAHLVSTISIITRAVEVIVLDEMLSVSAGRLSMEALRMGARRPFSIYDCTFVALAARRTDTLVTADRGQAALAERVGVAVQLL